MTASGQETTVGDLLPCQSVFLEISPVQKYRGSFPLTVIACTIITIVATSTVTIVILMLLGRSNGPLQEVTTVVEKQSSTGAVAVGVVLH